VKKRTAKRLVKSAEVIRDEYHDSKASTGQPRYYPELAENWLPAGFWDEDKNDSSFIIREDAIGGKGGALIATITVNPAFSTENQRRLAWFLSMAPELWRALRDASAHLMSSLEAHAELAQATKVLWESAYRFPFGQPMPPRDENVFCVAANKRISLILGSKATMRRKLVAGPLNWNPPRR
jgi:hypothetical protein